MSPLPTLAFALSGLPVRTMRSSLWSVARSRYSPRPARMSLDPTADVPMQQPVEPKRALDELVDFPCVFTFKVVGVNEGAFLDDISSAVAGVLDTETRYVKTSFRDKGKYRSITLHAPVNTATQIYDVYAAIDKDERVKFKF